MNKLGALILLVLSGCELSDGTHNAHLISKAVQPAGQVACYPMLGPEDIKGNYCLYYMGPLPLPLGSPSPSSPPSP